MSVSVANVALATGIAIAGGIAGGAISESDGKRDFNTTAFLVSNGAMLAGLALGMRGQGGATPVLALVGALGGQWAGGRVGAALVRDNPPEPTSPPQPAPAPGAMPQVPLASSPFPLAPNPMPPAVVSPWPAFTTQNPQLRLNSANLGRGQ